MKAVLAGKSRYSESFKSALSDAGFELAVAETAAELEALPEELPVVLLHDTKLSPLITDKAVIEKNILGLKPHDTIVFLMDRGEDTNPHIESRVLEMAAYLASVKRRVAVLMRSSRAPDDKFDDRYRDARQKGVTFIKYETLNISDNDGIDTINIWDGKLFTSLDTPLCIDCAGKPAPELDELVNALRIRTYDGGHISGNRWFLNQGTTFKRNVKLIDTIALGGDIRKIVPALVKDMLALERPGQEKTAFVDTDKCAFCYTCYRVCPHSALGPDKSASAMKVNDLLCEACGICVAVCPASAIEFKGVIVKDAFRSGAAGQNSEAVEATESKAAGGRRLKVFCCENSAFIASKEALAGMDAAVESVPCGGDVSAAMMTEALKSYDNVMVAVCCDDACRHRDGNKRCVKQVERLKDRLDKLGYDPGRLSFVQTGITMVNILNDAAFKALAGGGEK
ncbi:MAG TPA: hydrogenase iron-sulfur subunit [Anaerovoracaceae bacterium]|nr:hydrogenase iron-sulfur subunit [Anaerovoracaceae bacterium]